MEYGKEKVSILKRIKSFVMGFILLFCYFGRNFITVGIEAMILNITLDVFVVITFFLVLTNIWKKSGLGVNKIISTIICGVFIIFFSCDVFPYIVDLIGNNKEEVITVEYDVDYVEGNESSRLYLHVLETDERLIINHKLYGELRNSTSKIKVVYWENTGIIDSIEFIIED